MSRTAKAESSEGRLIVTVSQLAYPCDEGRSVVYRVFL
jgi:hypothetical protein